MKTVYFCVFISALAGCVFCDEKVVICYVGTWATYRWGLGKFDVSNIDSSLCSHLIYTFVGLGSDSSVISLDPWLDLNTEEGGGRDNFRLFNALKETNPKLKTLLAVGGYNEGSAKYSTMAASPSLRQNFIRTALSMVQTYGFDGLDLDWEYPNQRDSVNGAADVENLTTLLKELKEEFNKYGLLVTIAVAAVEKSASLSYDVVGVSDNVDFIHLMAYDLHGSWDPTTGHNAGLYASQSELSLPNESLFTVDASVQYWLGQGCPPDKLVLGLPFYGRTFTLANANNNGVGAPVNGAGIAGPYTVTNGLIAYNEFCDMLHKQTWEVRRDDLARVPYAVQNNNWVTYDDAQSITEKVEYAMKYNLGGVMVWSLESEDFNAVCSEESYPLLRTINRVMAVNSGATSTTSTASPETSTHTESTTEAEMVTTDSTPVEKSTTEQSTNEPSATESSTYDPSATEPSTDEPSTTESSTNGPSTTESSGEPSNLCYIEGIIPNPNDCGSFYYCVRNVDGSFDTVFFKCPNGLYWDQNIFSCNYANLVQCS